MVIEKAKINNYLLFFITSLTFVGYYIILLFIFNAGLSNQSRLFTVPTRLLIVFLFLLLIALNIKKLHFSWQNRLFLLFTTLYLIRIFIDYLSNEPFYLSSSELLLYFTSFTVIPFMTLSSFRLNNHNLSMIINSLLITGFMFSVIAVFSYKQFIGNVGRLSSSTAGEETISPLALSYCSILIIGVCSTFLFYNRAFKWQKILGIFTIVISIIPFFLGASRGALFALVLPFVFMVLVKNNIKSKVSSVFLIIFLLLVISYLDELLGSGLLERFSSISADIDEGSSSAVRVSIWESALDQFLNHPFFGDKLRINGYDGYAHNMLIEVLQAMGIIGFLPFLILLVYSFKVCIKIFREFPEYSWIAIIFLQGFIHYMFSGSFHIASWFWVPMALLINIESLIESNKSRNKKFGSQGVLF